MANRNSKHKTRIIREKVLENRRGTSIPFLTAQADVIERGSDRRPVEMAFTSKWESNTSFRLYGV